ncbi:hypothetical protein BC343_19475 [Mucilaginibacter pedocola]|uniref:Uncharacterized protein n=1 Tax=Mucilaginibacter pedocola TaxID=1792845 RepID=A0A1S9P6N6_9SPHI|nr:hypothetical protein BC343_19475 [Mucilaginibacter pedocola]
MAAHGCFTTAAGPDAKNGVQWPLALTAKKQSGIFVKDAPQIQHNRSNDPFGKGQRISYP